MNKNRKPRVTALRVAAVLFVLVLSTTGIVSGRYARYTTTVTGSDSARVAKYEVTVASDSRTTIELDPNNASVVNYNFTVSSGSEVAVEYDLSIIFKEPLPEGIDLSLSCAGRDIPLTLQNNTYTAINAGTFSPAGGTHAYTLTFKATQPVGEDELTGIVIHVDARQVD